MKLSANTKVWEVRKAFNDTFPYLHLDIYKTPQTDIESETKLTDIHKTLGEAFKGFKAGEISFSGNKKMMSLVEEFEKMGIHALVGFYEYSWDYSKQPKLSRCGFRYGISDTLKQLNDKIKNTKDFPAPANCW